MRALGLAALAAVFLCLSVALVAFWIGGARAASGNPSAPDVPPSWLLVVVGTHVEPDKPPLTVRFETRRDSEAACKSLEASIIRLLVANKATDIRVAGCPRR